jgi:hypothetical protein
MLFHDRSIRGGTAPSAGLLTLALTAIVLSAAGCASSSTTSGTGSPSPFGTMSATAPSPDPRVGLRAGLHNAEEASWNVKLVSNSPATGQFAKSWNSDISFKGNYAIQGNFDGFLVWDISNPASPSLVTSYYCPASQSDVSVYGNLLFVSGEGTGGRLDCSGEGVKEVVSHDRLRGIRIFDISDIKKPKYIANVQTCRGSHTHSVLADPDDLTNVYIYVSGSAGVRPAAELPGCVNESPDENQNSARFRIEVIKVPLAHPEQAAIVSSPRIFQDLTAPATHGAAPEDVAASKERAEQAKAAGQYVVNFMGEAIVLPPTFVQPMLDSVVAARKGTGAATAADSAALREALPGIIAKMFGGGDEGPGPKPGPDQCHDITLYPAIGLAGGACGGYGLLLDISDPVNPVRIDAAADSNFSYWHSATFNNDGTKVLFSDEWGGGTAPKCRATDKPEWGADAIFTLENRKMVFQSYYKMPAAQTWFENCVAHNGSLIPIPGRDVMVQAWYQGGISVFDWTDAGNPVEIGYFDRGPVDSTRLETGGSWSVYWYNGHLYSSEIARGLDVFELTPSAFLSQNELDAARTVHLDLLNAQGQPKFTWPPSFALAKAYVDQLERSKGLSSSQVSATRSALSGAESASGSARRSALTTLATKLKADAGSSSDSAKMQKLVAAVEALAGAN